MSARVEGEKLLVYQRSPIGKAIKQGEIISNLTQLIPDLLSLRTTEGNKKLNPIIHPYAIVVSQDCDLDWDFKARQPSNPGGKDLRAKLLPNILFCEVVTAPEVRFHPIEKPNAEAWNRIKINKDERYQFLQKVEPDDDAQSEGSPELVIDFRRYFTISTEEVYFRLEKEAYRRCHLQSPYLEHFSTRFNYYQFRVALPGDHISEPSTASR